MKETIDNYVNKGIVEDNSKLVRQALSFYFENHPYFSDKLDNLEEQLSDTQAKFKQLQEQIDGLQQDLKLVTSSVNKIVEKLQEKGDW